MTAADIATRSTLPEQTGKGLGWFSFALGAAELFAARPLTRALGIEGHETLVRLFGAREVAAGAMTLAGDERRGIQSRVAGDALDIGVLLWALGTSRKKANVGIALAAVVGVTVLDALVAAAFEMRRQREPEQVAAGDEQASEPRPAPRTGRAQQLEAIA